MFTFGVPLHGKSPYVKSLLLVEKKQDFVIRVGRTKVIQKKKCYLSPHHCDYHGVETKSNKSFIVMSSNFFPPEVLIHLDGVTS